MSAEDRREGIEDAEAQRGEGSGDAGAPEGGGAPAPATWAGRRDRAASESDGEPEGEHDAGQEEDAADEPPSRSGDTVEADTLRLGDREAAKEAALAGLRARAAAHAAKQGSAAGAATAPPAQPTDAPAPATAAGAAAAAVGARVAPADAAAATAGDGAPPPGEPEVAGDEKIPGRGLWARFLAASFLIVVSMATATAVSLLVYLTDIAEGLGGLEGLQGQLDDVSGKPQNFLILGSDERIDAIGDPGRSDTTILLRIDPDKDLISMLSVPRDLKVNIPGYGVGKFNEAYAFGGPKKTLEVVKQLTNNRIEINHLVNINFTGFADAVNAIDCVYIDVDRRYYVPPEADYAEIDIEAGYQRLCGLKALQYVRYRHDDTDLVRSARQQDFLREARQKVPPSKLLADRNELIDIFTDYTESDIGNVATLVELFKLMLGARNAQINQVHFPAQIGGPEDPYVTASTEAIQNAVDQFLGVGLPSADQPQKNGGEGSKAGDEKAGGSGKQDEKPEPPPPPPMDDATAQGELYANAVDDNELKFPIYYPTLLVPGSTLTDASRSFPIDGPGDDVYRGYKLVASLPPGPANGYTAYYGVSGTDWVEPPILENPSERRVIDGREYLLFYDGDRLRMVGWKTDKAAYWISNTLAQVLDEDQMLTMATAMRELGG